MGWYAVLLLLLAVVLGAFAISVGGNARSEAEANRAAILAFAATLCLLTMGVLGVIWLAS